MKKFAFYMLIVMLFVFSSCKSEEITVITCGDDEILVDGVCQTVKTDFELVFDAMDALTNYTLDISIQQTADLYEIVMLVDDQTSSFMMDGKTEYYQKNGSTCSRFFPVGEGYRSEVISCTSTQNSFHFFNDLEADWFQIVSDKYFLKTEYYDEVAAFFQSEFPLSTVSNLELVIGDDYFEQIIFNVTVDLVMYQFTMTLSDIGQTTVTLPTV